MLILLLNIKIFIMLFSSLKDTKHNHYMLLKPLPNF